LRISVSKAHRAFALGIKSGIFVLVLVLVLVIVIVIVIVIDDLDSPKLARPPRL